MFLMIGLGERAGSGLTKIQRGWRESGKQLNLADSFDPYDQTRLDMAFSREGPDSARRFGKMSGKVLHLLEEAPELSIPEDSDAAGKVGTYHRARNTRIEINREINANWPG